MEKKRAGQPKSSLITKFFKLNSVNTSQASISQSTSQTKRKLDSD